LIRRLLLFLLLFFAPPFLHAARHALCICKHHILKEIFKTFCQNKNDETFQQPQPTSIGSRFANALHCTAPHPQSEINIEQMQQLLSSYKLILE
jgi:hypothetical protein